MTIALNDITRLGDAEVEFGSAGQVYLDAISGSTFVGLELVPDPS